MKRFAYLFAAIASFVTISSAALPQTAAAEPSTEVTLTQSILPPSCYDTVTVNQGTTDYIAVWECETQRD